MLFQLPQVSNLKRVHAYLANYPSLSTSVMNLLKTSHLTQLSYHSGWENDAFQLISKTALSLDYGLFYLENSVHIGYAELHLDLTII